MRLIIIALALAMVQNITASAHVWPEHDDALPVGALPVLPGSAHDLKPLIDSLMLVSESAVRFDVDSSLYRDAAAVNLYINRCRGFVESGDAEPEAVEDAFDRLGLSWIRRADADGYHYFIVNTTDDEVYMPAEPAVGYVDALWYDPVTGDIYPAANYNGSIEMEFAPGESRILRLYDHGVDTEGMSKRLRSLNILDIDLSTAKWILTFTADPKAKKTKLKHLQPINAQHYANASGLADAAVFTTDIDISAEDMNYDWRLDLGDVFDTARVYVNGQSAGTVWGRPYVLEIGDLLHEGTNTLSVEVGAWPWRDGIGLSSARLLRR